MLSALLLVVVVIGIAREVSISGLHSRKQSAHSPEAVRAPEKAPQ